jgi:putative ABC transport system permease protein
MDTLLADLRFALRSLRKHPTVFAVAVLSLAFGVAANTTIFAVVDAFLVRPLPVPDADRIAAVWTTNPTRGWTRISSSAGDFTDWRQESRTLELAASTGGSFNLSVPGDRPERVQGARVTPNYFRVFAFAPVAGRAFLPEEGTPGNDRSVVLSHAFWTRRFGADRGVVGSTISLDGRAYTVVGVMPEDMRFPNGGVDVWTPLVLDAATLADRRSRYLAVTGKLRPGATLEGARAEMEGVQRRLAGAHPDNTGNGVLLNTLHDDIYDEEFKLGTSIAMVATIFVLLIACANVANLLLARGAARARELALRTAIGASRRRLVGQLLTESVVLALVGGTLGVLLSVSGVRALRAIIPADFYRAETVALDGRALVFTLVVCLGAGILFGLAPALQATRELGTALREGGRSASLGARRNRLGASFVVAQLALSLALLISAGLLLKASVKLQSVDLGYDPANVLTMRVTLPESQYPDTVKVGQFHAELLRRLRALPGVEAAGATTMLPMDGGTGTGYTIDGEPKPKEGEEHFAQYRATTPGYLPAMRIALARGRDFTDQDRPGAPLVMLVNEAFVRRHWPGRGAEAAIGKRVVLTSGPREVVGVLRDARDFGPEDDTFPMMYVPAIQWGNRSLSYVIRSSRAAGPLADAVRAELAALDPSLPAYAVRPMQEIVDGVVAGSQALPRVLGAFGVIALFLAVIGVYGVMAFNVGQRTQEVGIRMALGAQRGDIGRLVLRQGLLLAGVGLGIGLVLALGLTSALGAFLHGVSAFDPSIFGGVTLALCAVALGATWVPARRATKVDPLVALRYE